MERISIIHFDKSKGPEKMISYPPVAEEFPKSLFLEIWTKHELQKQKKMIQFTPKDKNIKLISIIQKFKGEIYFLVLVYNKEAKIDDVINNYPDLFSQIAQNLIQMLGTDQITRLISEVYSSIKNYIKLEEEENLLNFFRDKIKYIILKIFRKGAISKSNLIRILEHQHGFSTINIDLILMAFIREDLIIKKKIAGNEDYYFLIKDILFNIRLPPKNRLEFFKEFSGKEKENISLAYDHSLIEFFNNYDYAQEEDTNMILMFLLNKNVYFLLKELRIRPILISQALNRLNNNEDLLNELLDQQFLFENKGYIFLLTDIRFIKFTPTYLISRLNSRYESNNLSLEGYLTHLELLLDEVTINGPINYQII